MPQCPFCHKNVSGLMLMLHSFWHTRRKRDGEQRSHVTLPASERYPLPIDNEPVQYCHVGTPKKPGCGGCTLMPEEVQRSYLVMPEKYGSTFCAGCREYRSLSEFEWVETGENLQAYMERIARQLDGQ